MKNFQNINFSLIQHSCLFHIWRKKKIRTTFTGKWSTFEQRKSNNHHWLTSINYYSRKNTVERNSIEIPSTIYTTFPLNGVITRWDIHLKPEDLFFFFFFFNQDERSIRSISPSRLCNLRIFPNNTILAKIRFHPPFFSSSKRNHRNLTSTNQTISNIHGRSFIESFSFRCEKFQDIARSHHFANPRSQSTVSQFFQPLLKSTTSTLNRTLFSITSRSGLRPTIKIY